KIGPDPRNFNQRVSLGRNDLLIRTFLRHDADQKSDKQADKYNHQPVRFFLFHEHSWLFF
ncbi:hypothetical protein RZP76_18540, partial [Raoultella ornithinolytica]|nr:hypothetical protein [Raoultella ornithinolytica]